MIRTTLSTLILLITFSISAKDPVFFTYPDSLKQGADAVVVYDHLVYERTSLSQLLEKRSVAVTILNEDGARHAMMYVNYNNLSKINVFECEVYGRLGQKIKSYKKKDIHDFSNYSDFTFFSDNRLKMVVPSSTSYPYTVVFHYEKEYDGFYMLNGWSPVQSYKLAVCESSLAVHSSEELPFMFKVNGKNELAVDTIHNEAGLLCTYKISNFKALKKEMYSPSFVSQVPHVLLAPYDFIYDDHKGCNASWKSASDFTYSLFSEEDQLTEATKKDLDVMKVASESQRDLVKKVYKYMQSKTRYVGVQVGIGGWQPMPSLKVDETGYGDCKGLSYYTRAMLAYLDIESVFIVIGSGDMRIKYDDFTTNQANHAILCVPMSEDTVWLECTSQTAPFDYLSTSCTSRQVLMVKEQDGELCYIPQMHDNCRKRTLNVKYLDQKLLCDDTTTCSGVFFDQFSSLNRMSDRELLKYLQQSSEVSDINIKKCSVSLDEDSVLVHAYQCYATSSGVTVAGNRLFLDLNLNSPLSKIKKQRSERRTALSLGEMAEYVDDMLFEIPDGYVLDFLPPSVSHESDFCSIDFSITEVEGQIRVVRRYVDKGGDFPKERYEEFVADRNEVADMDYCHAILKRVD